MAAWALALFEQVTLHRKVELTLSIDSVIRDCHIYKEILTPFLGAMSVQYQPIKWMTGATPTGL